MGTQGAAIVGARVIDTTRPDVTTGALLARPLLDGTGYHQMVAGSAAPVTTAARGGSESESESEPTVEPGSYLTDDPNQSGSPADPASVLW